VSPNCYSSFIEVSVSGQIERKFVQLERKLLSELNSIKAMLTNERPISVKTTDYEYFSYDENLAEKSLGSAIDEDSIVSVTESVTRDSSWVRTEIDKFNNTVYTLKSEKCSPTIGKSPKFARFSANKEYTSEVQTFTFLVGVH
jgi:hypothetical protein